MSSDNGDKRFSSSTGIFLEQEEQETSPRCRNTNFSCPRTEFLKGFLLCGFPCYLKEILGKNGSTYINKDFLYFPIDFHLSDCRKFKRRLYSFYCFQFKYNQ